TRGRGNVARRHRGLRALRRTHLAADERFAFLLERLLRVEDAERRRWDVGHHAVRGGESARRELRHGIRRLPLLPSVTPDRGVRRNHSARERGAELVLAHEALLARRVRPSPLDVAAHARIMIAPRRRQGLLLRNSPVSSARPQPPPASVIEMTDVRKTYASAL